MKKLMMIAGVASLFASGAALADADDTVVILDDTDVSTATLNVPMPPAAAPAATNTVLSLEGAVAASTCRIASGSQNQTVTLDTVESNKLKNMGAYEEYTKPFTVVLQNCPTPAASGKTAVRLAFDNTASTVDAQTGNLKDTSTAANTAKNVQFQLLNRDNSVIALNQPKGQQNVQKTALSNQTDITFDFGARYYVTGDVSAGSLSSTVPFSIDYE